MVPAIVKAPAVVGVVAVKDPFSFTDKKTARAVFFYVRESDSCDRKYLKIVGLLVNIIT
jgi:hypothetical protein